MKLYIEAKQYPWVTWGNQMWKVSRQIKDKELEVVADPDEADTLLIEWDEVLQSSDLQTRKPTWIFVESIDSHLVPIFVDFVKNNKDVVGVLSQSYYMYELLSDKGIKVFIWDLPTRVQPSLWYKGGEEVLEKNGDFVIVSNATRYPDNIAEVVKTYFAMYMRQGEDEEKIPDHNLDIYSAYEMPFETFNNVRFNGLQSNLLVHRKIKKSKLFISPYNGNGVPLSVVDAVFLGTPILVRDTEANRAIVPWGKNFFREKEDLAKVLKYYMDIPISSEEYRTSIEENFARFVVDFSPDRCYTKLKNILIGDAT